MLVLALVILIEKAGDIPEGSAVVPLAAVAGDAPAVLGWVGLPPAAHPAISFWHWCRVCAAPRFPPPTETMITVG
jgi:hypothetical protein